MWDVTAPRSSIKGLSISYQFCMFIHKISSHFSLVEGQPMHSSWALKHDAIFLKISRRLLVPEQWFPQCYKILFLQVSHLRGIAGANSTFQGEYSHAHFLSHGRPSYLNNQMWAHLVTLLTSLNETYLELCWPVGILGKSELNYFSVFLLLSMPSACPDHNSGLSKKRKILLTR